MKVVLKFWSDWLGYKEERESFLGKFNFYFENFMVRFGFLTLVLVMANASISGEAQEIDGGSTFGGYLLMFAFFAYTTRYGIKGINFLRNLRGGK